MFTKKVLFSTIGSELDKNDIEEKVEVARDTIAVQQLLTHVPDIVINCDHKKQVPYVEQFRGVCLFADISGKFYLHNSTFILLFQQLCLVFNSVVLQNN